MKELTPHPPRWAERFLAWYCKPDLLEDLQGDLNEYFDRNVKTKGVQRARLIYVLDVFKFLRLYTIRKPEFFNVLIQWIMISSYIKTSGRSIARNKLFSSINIIGLAISMSVGLLLVAFLSDIFSYDEFHEKKNRIYRIVTTHQFGDNPEHHLASTSVNIGYKLRESVAGIEAVSILRSGFGSNAHFGDNIVPIQGLWADGNFLKIFSFPMIYGNTNTALQEPYSLVVTETYAKKLFGNEKALGKTVRLDTRDYTVTGVLKDIPTFSHLQFHALASFSTVALEQENNKDFLSWDNVWQNYVYLLVPEVHDEAALQTSLDKICERENKHLQNQKITFTIQPMKEFVVGRNLSNIIGPVVPMVMVWVLAALALIVMLSACFNYTNLSIARSLRRSREVGIRKVIGALKSHVLGQFISESVIIALLALIFSFFIYLVLRPQLFLIAPDLAKLVTLELSPRLILYFIMLAIFVGVAAGFVPALFFSRINTVQVLKNVSSIKVFEHVSIRKTLIVLQYTFSLIFITTTIIVYQQYEHFRSLDLGFNPNQIVNIDLQGNKAGPLIKELKEIPEASGIATSMMITTTTSMYGYQVKHQGDSADVYYNVVDEHYLPLHGHILLAGRNFNAQAHSQETEVLVNEQVLKRFNITPHDPVQALGETITIDGKDLRIVGVMKDFHYSNPKMGKKNEAVIFRYSNTESNFVNLKVASTNWKETFSKIEKAWHTVDPVKPLQAHLYTDQIARVYNDLAAIVKIIGYLAFLAITVASMGLFGMVVFTTETRLKEISIRKVMGASEVSLIYLLSKGFLFLLFMASAISLPLTYFFFDKVVFINVAYHEPIDVLYLLMGVVIVLGLAFLTIGSQTLHAARSNPAHVLKTE